MSRITLALAAVTATLALGAGAAATLDPHSAPAGRVTANQPVGGAEWGGLTPPTPDPTESAPPTDGPTTQG